MRSSQGLLVRGLDGEQEWAIGLGEKEAGGHVYKLELRSNADTFRQYLALLKDGGICQTFDVNDRAAAFCALEDPEAIAGPQEYKVVVMISIQGFREETVTAWSRTEAEKLATDQAIATMEPKIFSGSIEGLRALKAKGFDGRLAVSANPGTAQEIKARA